MNAQFPTQTNTDQSVPNHIAIIMDGNGRWAKARHKPRVFGHQEGVKTVRRIVEHASEIGVKCLTLYSFSTENWSRPKAEIAALFALLRRYVSDDLETLDKRGVRIRILGAQQGLSDDMLELLERVQERTRNNDKFSLNIAFNYGGRDEIIRAAQKYIDAAGQTQEKAQNQGQERAPLTEEKFSQYLDTNGLPDPDLMIRTSGECRVSNFLLWQAAYAELVFMDELWPDFSNDDFDRAIAIFNQRTRRFGAVDSKDIG